MLLLKFPYYKLYKMNKFYKFFINYVYVYVFLIISSSRFMINNLFGLNKLFTFLGFELQKVF